MASVCTILPSWKLPFRFSFVMTPLGVCNHFTRRTSTISWVTSDIRRSSTVAEWPPFFHQTCSQCFDVTRVQCAHHLKSFITGIRQSSGHHLRHSKMCGARGKLHLERRAQGRSARHVTTKFSALFHEARGLCCTLVRILERPPTGDGSKLLQGENLSHKMPQHRG